MDLLASYIIIKIREEIKENNMNTKDYRVEMNEIAGTRVYQYDETNDMWNILGLVYNVKNEYEAVSKLLEEINHKGVDFYA